MFTFTVEYVHNAFLTTLFLNGVKQAECVTSYQPEVSHQVKGNRITVQVVDAVEMAQFKLEAK